jgi:RimJ/RimL family protein N-acetyltransferase
MEPERCRHVPAPAGGGILVAFAGVFHFGDKIQSMTDDVRLRPVSESDVDLLDSNLASKEGTGAHQWFGFTSSCGIRRRLAENGLLGGDGGMLTVLAGQEPIGRVEWFKADWGRSDTSSCWTIAVAIYQQHRGRGIGTEAHRQLVDYLFGTTRVERIQAYTDRENVAEQRALEKSGFAREGVLRSAQWRDGGWHDQILYSVVRSSS